MKNKILCVGAIVLIIVIMKWGLDNWSMSTRTNSDASSSMGKPADIVLPDTNIKVDFAEVLITNQKETRELIVSELSAKVEYTATDYVIKNVDWKIFEKSKKITYNGDGRFVVDLDKIEKKDIFNNVTAKELKIKIDHARLQTVEIDPKRIKIGEQENGLFASKEMKLTFEGYKLIENEVVDRLTKAFNTSENAQKADMQALDAVKKIYEPIIHAIDSEYKVIIEFKD